MRLAQRATSHLKKYPPVCERLSVEEVLGWLHDVGRVAISWRKAIRRGWSCSTMKLIQVLCLVLTELSIWQPADDLPAAPARDPNEFLHVQ